MTGKIIVLEDAVPMPLVRSVAATWPDDKWLHWHRYHDATADKFASKDAGRLPHAAKAVIAELARLPVESLVGSRPCFPDFDLHGAGLHMLRPGGFLGLHLDGAKHPIMEWSRVANAVLFVDDWQQEWGGELQMVEPSTKAVVQSVTPKRGAVALFVTSETAWHQVATVTGPMPRRTVSMFWWCESPPQSDRDRALFARSQG